MDTAARLSPLRESLDSGAFPSFPLWQYNQSSFESSRAVWWLPHSARTHNFVQTGPPRDLRVDMWQSSGTIRPKSDKGRGH